ncbi:porin, partial [Salmonella enterica subsp. enterica serovar Java]|nr:porin [Salmonella enterica subsp. enterica serovar Java]
EPMEYVRVCDTYGTGFYYIPGTETCLRVGGYVRYDVGAGAFGLHDMIDKSKGFGGNGFAKEWNDTYYKRARLSLILDARTETELGTLRAYGQVHFQNTTGVVAQYNADGDYIGNYGATNWGTDLNHAYIELGGFRV